MHICMLAVGGSRCYFEKGVKVIAANYINVYLS